jgi:hypothetical protein
MGRPSCLLPDDVDAHDAQVVADLTDQVREALAYLRDGQGFGTITVRMTVRNGVVALYETAPSRSLKPDYARNRS